MTTSYHASSLRSSRFIARLAAAVSLVSLMGLPQSTLALEISFEGFRELDQSLESVKAQGFSNWARDKFQGALREHLPSAFGDRAPTVRRVVTTGSHVYSIQGRGVDVLQHGLSADPGSEYIRRDKEFWAWLRGEELRALVRDAIPERMRPVLDSAERIRDNAAWLAERGNQALHSAQQALQSTQAWADRVKVYFSETTGYGLEPGGRDAQVISGSSGTTRSAIAPDAERIESARQHLAAPTRSLTLNELIASQGAPTPRDEATINPQVPTARAQTARPSTKGGFDDDIAALERDLGMRGSSGPKRSTDLDSLESSLGMKSSARSNERADWAEEARRAAASTQQWEADQTRKAEEQRRVLAARQAQEQRDRERRAAESEAERARRNAELENERARRATAAESERARAAESDRAARPSQSASSSASESSSDGGSFLGEVLLGVGKAYLQNRTAGGPSSTSRPQGSGAECKSVCVAYSAPGRCEVGGGWGCKQCLRSERRC